MAYTIPINVLPKDHEWFKKFKKRLQKNTEGKVTMAMAFSELRKGMR